MAGLLGFGRTNNNPGPATALRVSTSLYGRPKAYAYGQCRLSPNLIDYAGFKATPSSQGGKGGLVGMGKGQSGQYDYSVSAIASLGEQIANVLTIYNGDSIDFLVNPPPAILAALAAIGITPSYGNGVYNVEIHLGTPSQTASSYWTSAFPTRALNYRNEAYVVFNNLGLGSSPTFPNFNFEVLGTFNSDVPALGPDANFADVAADLLTNSAYGVLGFTSGFLGDFATAKNYWRAAGLLVSDALADSKALNGYFKDLMTALNADFRWSDGQLDIVPFGDVAITANGATYTPNVTPIYDLTTNDFLALNSSSGSSSSPVQVSRKSTTQIKNKIQLEYLDRNQLYNPAIVYASDEASIAQTWLRMADKKSCNFFALQSAAQMSAQLQLHREAATAISAQIRVGRRFGLLEPLDLITITEPALQLNRQLCRIMEIAEDTDRTRTMTLEFVALTAAAPVYGVQASMGAGRNSNAPAANINPPIFFEPPDQVGNGLTLWIGISGSDPDNFGGCEVWVSSDDLTYTLAGEFNGQSRMGVLTAPLGTVTANASGGPTVDNTNTLSIDLSESDGELSNGSENDFTALNTAFLIGSEILAYRDVTLTGANKYDITPLMRNAFATTMAAHSTGDSFLRLDGTEFKWPYTADRVGQQLYFKFLAFNPFGGGKQQLSDVGSYTYTLKGAALSSPLPDVNAIRPVFEANLTKIWWDEIEDFRPVSYEIRKGSSWGNGQFVSRVAHPPFVAFGDDTYWIAAFSQPASGLQVYSVNPQQLSLSGTTLAQNLVKSWDEQATLWTGTFSTGATTSGSGGSAVMTLTPPTMSGTYEVPAGHVIDIGYVAQALVTATYETSGFPVNQNILSITNILAEQDILSADSSRFVDGHLEIATGVTVGVWSAWRKFVPGVYLCRYVKLRMALETFDSTIVPVGSAFVWNVSVPRRSDHYLNQSIGSGGTTINFQPDGSGSPAAFNGGPDGSTSSLPSVTATWSYTAGDILTYTVAGTKDSVTIQIKNGGVGVARTGVNVIVEGF